MRDALGECLNVLRIDCIGRDPLEEVSHKLGEARVPIARGVENNDALGLGELREMRTSEVLPEPRGPETTPCVRR